MSGARVAVTGATGFLGHHLCRVLRQSGHDVSAVVRPTSDTSRLKSLGVKCQIASLDDVDSLAAVFRECTGILHLAGAVDFGGDWRRFEQANVEGTRNVISAARVASVRRVVHCSSIVAIGASRRPVPVDETAKWNLDPARVAYVTTKRQAEEIALSANDHRLKVVCVNPSCILGPDDFTDSEFGVMCQRFWRGRLPVHFGGGNNFVDVRDVSDGLLAALQRGRPGQRYILGGANRSMTAFFSELARACPALIPRWRLPSAIAPAIAWIEQMRGKTRRRPYLSPAQSRLLRYFFYYDCAKAQRELGFRPRPLSQTITDSFAFWNLRKAS